jgi:hypothetical protein
MNRSSRQLLPRAGFSEDADRHIHCGKAGQLIERFEECRRGADDPLRTPCTICPFPQRRTRTTFEHKNPRSGGLF